MTFKPPVYTEQEAAQTLLGPRASRVLREKHESVAFLSKHTLGLSWFPEESFTLVNAGPRI